MNHKNLKRVALCTAALVALLLLVAVGVGVGVSASRGATAASPCCDRRTPSQST